MSPCVRLSLLDCSKAQGFGARAWAFAAGTAHKGLDRADSENSQNSAAAGQETGYRGLDVISMEKMAR